jgi:ubiquinone/menaquinone biosynthesis C-methylase UbiE
MENLEQTNVKDVYNKIANHFDRTRHSLWDIPNDFINGIKPDSLCLDLGCGNGKYLGVRNDITFFALDNSENLLDIVNKKYPYIQTTLSDVTATTYKANSFDAIISIAVIHHLATESRRIQMIQEIKRILKIGGLCLITSWAASNNHTNTIKQLDKSIKLDEDNNYLIPWENRDDKIISYRFYHLVEEGELEQLISFIPNLKIKSCTLDKNNWNIIIEKIS